MGKYYNPFKPNYPIYDGLFTGRWNELKKIDTALDQLDSDNPQNLLFTGERGIGKTSLLLVAKHFATGNVKLNKEHKYITVNINVNGNTTLVDFILRFKKMLDRELYKLDKTKKVLDSVWGFVERLEVSGVKLNSKSTSGLEEITDDFTFSLVESIEKIKASKIIDRNGIVLIIDEADTSNKDLGLGSFLKNLTESLTLEECHSFMIIMCGLPNTTDILRKSHESSPRLFEEIELGPLTSKDTLHIFSEGLKSIKEKEGVEIVFDEEAKKLFCGYCEGYPHFIQQISHSIIENLTGTSITESLVSESMNGKGGALDLIGKRYYTDLFYDKIKVDSYRQILTIMAENWNDWTSKTDIREKFTGSGSDLNNGIKALRDRNIILTKRGVQGVYRLQWLSFAFWIKIHKHFE